MKFKNESNRVLAAARIIDVMLGGRFDYGDLDDSSFLESADWMTALAYADAALSLGSGRCRLLEMRVSDAHRALRSIAEGNLGDAPGQANYETIKQVARNALKGDEQ